MELARAFPLVEICRNLLIGLALGSKVLEVQALRLVDGLTISSSAQLVLDVDRSLERLTLQQLQLPRQPPARLRPQHNQPPLRLYNQQPPHRRAVDIFQILVGNL